MDDGVATLFHAGATPSGVVGCAIDQSNGAAAMPSGSPGGSSAVAAGIAATGAAPRRNKLPRSATSECPVFASGASAVVWANHRPLARSSSQSLAAAPEVGTADGMPPKAKRDESVAASAGGTRNDSKNGCARQVAITHTRAKWIMAAPNTKKTRRQPRNASRKPSWSRTCSRAAPQRTTKRGNKEFGIAEETVPNTTGQGIFRGSAISHGL